MSKFSFAQLVGRLCAPLCEQECYYINGSYALPSPLSAQEEAELLSHLDQEQARQTLIEHNLRLVVYIAKKFENTNIGIEDLISIGTIGLIKAIHTFRPDKNIKLATYGSRCIENEILMYLRKNASQRSDISFDEPLHIDWDGNELLLSDVLCSEEDNVGQQMESQEEHKTVENAIEKLPPRERTIIELRFGLKTGKEMTQKEVADLLGISQSYISRLEKKIIGRLKEEIAQKL